MKCRETHLFKQDGTCTVEVADITVEEHIALKLQYVGQMIAGEGKALNLTSEDLWKYQSNIEALSTGKIERIGELKELQVKHAQIKVAIKACTMHEELDGITWEDFNVS